MLQVWGDEDASNSISVSPNQPRREERRGTVLTEAAGFGRLEKETPWEKLNGFSLYQATEWVLIQ
jgi:hypothetical protein